MKAVSARLAKLELSSGQPTIEDWLAALDAADPDAALEALSRRVPNPALEQALEGLLL